VYPWINIGFSNIPTKRVGFRIESLGPLSQEFEILIIEILTNGRMSPQHALREAALLLVYKFSAVAKLRLPKPIASHTPKRWKEQLQKKLVLSSKKSNKRITHKTKLERQTFYDLFDNYLTLQIEHMGIDLGTLDLDIARYRELRSLGILTIGQLIETLAFKSYNFPPLLRKKRQQSLFRLGLFSLFLHL
jgi:DNA-directed RNA polymerase alpha subunit